MSGGINCYPGTDVLVNKYDIKDKDLLDKFEVQKVTTKLMSLDVNPDRISRSCDKKHLVNLHKFLFGEIYEWAGTFRKENLYKSERVLSGGSAVYSEHNNIEKDLDVFFKKYNEVDWKNEKNLSARVTDFLTELWSIHPFREGNTRTCVTYVWSYLDAQGILFEVELLRKHPHYVRDALVMANYDQKKYISDILEDALSGASEMKKPLDQGIEEARESYKIAKEDYEAFRERYGIKKSNDRDKGGR